MCSTCSEREMINGKYYFTVTNDAKDWNTAKTWCKTFGANLFEPRNQADNDAVGTRVWVFPTSGTSMDLDSYWIGISDQEAESK